EGRCRGDCQRWGDDCEFLFGCGAGGAGRAGVSGSAVAAFVGYYWAGVGWFT
ncbi:hypothetical protein IID19_00805, partial [Patescibacteria group bacterium]|nr:hypothetical protein [Patescibacteria group bacterium]